MNVFRAALSEVNAELEIRLHAAEEVGPTLRLTQRALDALFVHRPTGFDNAYKGRVPVIGLQVDIYPSGLAAGGPFERDVPVLFDLLDAGGDASTHVGEGPCHRFASAEGAARTRREEVYEPM